MIGSIDTCRTSTGTGLRMGTQAGMAEGGDDTLVQRILQEIEALLQLLLQQLNPERGQDDEDATGSAPVARKSAGPSMPAAPEAAPPEQAQAQRSAPSSPAPPDAAPQPAAAAAPVQPTASASGGDLSPREVASQFGNEIAAASKATGVPPGILAGQIWQESKGKPDTPGGGLMQLGDHEFQQYGGGDIANARDNIAAGAKYMQALSGQFGGNVGAALRAYNSGPNGVDTQDLNATPAGTGDPAYVQKVMQAAQESGLSTTGA